MVDTTTSLELIWWIVCFTTVLLVFINLQVYRNDPERKRKNEEWFAQFQANLAQRYRDPELAWRAHAMERHFQGILDH